MLGRDDARHELGAILAKCRCEIELPPTWHDFFEKTGLLTGAYDEKRRFRRSHFRGCAVLRYGQTFPSLSRPSTWHKVYTKDISRCGLGFLHSEQLFPRESMRVILPDGSQRTIEVVRCRRLKRRCFEIGARFVGQSPAPNGEPCSQGS